MSTATPGAGLSTKVQDAAARLDAHVRDIVEWHFNPETGCPFWLEFASKLSWDPRTEIHGLADLRKFPPFEDEWLRGGPVRRWVPKGLAHLPAFVFETGGNREPFSGVKEREENPAARRRPVSRHQAELPPGVSGRIRDGDGKIVLELIASAADNRDRLPLWRIEQGHAVRIDQSRNQNFREIDSRRNRVGPGDDFGNSAARDFRQERRHDFVEERLGQRL